MKTLTYKILKEETEEKPKVEFNKEFYVTALKKEIGLPEIAYEKVVYDPLILAYMAGIVDGEGSLCIYRVDPASYNRYQTPNFRSVLNISNTKKELFDWIEEKFHNLNHKWGK